MQCDEFPRHNKSKKIERKRFQIINCSMQMKWVKKNQFAGLNDKCFYFHNGIVLPLFGHALLKILRKEKEKCRSNIQNKIHKKSLDFYQKREK